MMLVMISFCLKLILINNRKVYFPQLLVWAENDPEDMLVVTITPDYPGARHTGLVGGLKKFTWYFGSILCFTTPGDGPRSPPTLLQTHEDSEYKQIILRQRPLLSASCE